jgi:hypothetical protein
MAASRDLGSRVVFKDYAIKWVLFVWALSVFIIFAWLIELWTFYLLLWNYILILKIPPVTLFRGSKVAPTCTHPGNAYRKCFENSYRQPPRTCTFTRIFSASYWGWTVTLKNINQWQRGEQVQKLYAASGTILRMGFNKSKQNLSLYYSLRPGQSMSNGAWT